jgi:hypothetical protein
MSIEAGNVYSFRFGKTKDGTVTMEDVSNAWSVGRWITQKRN